MLEQPLEHCWIIVWQTCLFSTGQCCKLHYGACGERGEGEAVGDLVGGGGVAMGVTWRSGRGGCKGCGRTAAMNQESFCLFAIKIISCMNYE